MPSDGVRDAATYEVTPGTSKGALGTWQALGQSRTPSRRSWTMKEGPRPACKPQSRGVYVCQHFSFLGSGKAAGGHARVRTGLGKTDRPGSQGGLRKRGLWQTLNGHVKRKRRNCQAFA